MRLDQYSNPVFNDQDILDALYKGQKIPNDMFVDPSKDVDSFEKVLEKKFWLPLDNYDISLEEYDAAMQEDWFMPDSYKSFDIEEYIKNKCPPANISRVEDELVAFKERNMLNLLRWLKYFVDTCNENNVVWGIGRGSSVASYVLYLLDVHSIDSVEYNLDWQEFLR